jgi:glycosyltransferase involved in cell wall biosynthesis
VDPEAPIRVGIDAYSVKDLTGIGRYTRETIRALVAQAGPGIELTLFHPPGSAWREFDPGPVARAIVPARSRLAWEAYALRAALRDHPVDVFHGPDFTLPAAPIPAVVTAHDVAFFDHPELLSWRARLLYRLLAGRAARRAAVILCPTHDAASRVSRALRVDPAKIRVVGEGVAPCFSASAGPVDDTPQDGPAPPFVLAVGTVQPRKNLVSVAAAVARLRAAGHDLTLAIAGGDGLHANAIRAEVVRTLGPSRVWFGRPPDAALARLYRSASVVCVASLYEGFGLPVVEALACGAPVVISDLPALVEVAGGAAVVADRSAARLAEAMASVLEESASHREGRRRRGLERAAQFSWTDSAVRLARIYREVAATQST